MKRSPRVQRLLLAVLAALSVCALGLQSHAQAAAAPGGSFDATIVKVGPGGGSVVVTLKGLAGKWPLSTPDAAASTVLKSAIAGDIAKIDVDSAKAPTAILKLNAVDRPIPFWPRVLAVGLAALVLFGVVAFATGWKPVELLISEDGRFSNSQVQLALWFSAVAVVYSAAIGLRFAWLGADFIGGVGITSNLIALTGLSAFSFGGAKVITTQKINSAAPGGPVKKPSDDAPNLIADLFKNDAGDADLGDLQMILITGAAVIIFVATSFHFLGELQLSASVTLPDVDTALLASFGIGQGAYLVKKAALPLGQG